MHIETYLEVHVKAHIKACPLTYLKYVLSQSQLMEKHMMSCFSGRVSEVMGAEAR